MERCHIFFLQLNLSHQACSRLDRGLVSEEYSSLQDPHFGVQPGFIYLESLIRDQGALSYPISSSNLLHFKKNEEYLTTTVQESWILLRSGQDGLLWPVSRKLRKLFGPVKPFLVQLYLKTEKCIYLKLLV